MGNTRGTTNLKELISALSFLVVFCSVVLSGGPSSKPNFNIPILASSLRVDRGGGTEVPALSQPLTIPQSSWCWQSTELWDTQHKGINEKWKKRKLILMSDVV